MPMADSEPVMHHLDLESLRGPKYVFTPGPNGIPDCTDWHACRVYMDSFILYAIPVANEDISNLRTKVTVELFKVLMTDRITWAADDWVNCIVDFHVWDEIFEQYAEPDERPQFPWKIIPHDQSKPVSLMYRSWRESLNLEFDMTGPIKDSNTSKGTMNAVENCSFELHCDVLRTKFPDLHLAYGIEPTMANEDGDTGTDLSHPAQYPLVLPAPPPSPPPRVVTSSPLEVPCADHAGQSRVPPAGQSEPTSDQSEPRDSDHMNMDEVVMHPILKKVWDEEVERGYWMKSALVVSPFEIRLPPPSITNLILPTRGIIRTMNMQNAGMVYIVRRSENPNGVTIAISLPRSMGSRLSTQKRETILVAWKCIVRWVTVIYCTGMVQWETWEFLWSQNLYRPMLNSASLHEAFLHLAEAENQAKEILLNAAHNDGRSVAATSRHNYLENLAKAAALNKDATDALTEILARGGDSYEAKGLVLDAICRYAASFKVTGRDIEQVDVFFQISALAVYAVANSPLEESVDFPVANRLFLKLQELA
ncbi:unnamed protein product [Clonostachys rhizophaga]|uniref:Uncharacterized protein n=1 Tax=Clonostachys rhizophaga TaxID=160324 RepID=A0A9N9V6U1_9HYPO|nr:unnamed protein product [Clonostachys rhizophaga]